MTLDGGENWKKITENEGLPKGELGRIGIAVAKSNSKTVYALIENKEKNGLYTSKDGGVNWSLVSEDENIGNRPFYYSDIHVDPFNENTIYSLWSIMTKSDDGGKSWRVIAPYYKIHPDHQALWMDPNRPGHMIEGNDGGVNITWDGGDSWRFVENLPVAQFYHINVDNQKPYNVYGGLQDNGVWMAKNNTIENKAWEQNGRHPWTSIMGGDGMQIQIDNRNPGTIITGYQFGNYYRLDLDNNKRTSIKPKHKLGEAPLRFNWQTPVLLSESGKDTVFLDAKQGNATNAFQALRVTFDQTTIDLLKSIDWVYSYRIVVKQREQEYYNWISNIASLDTVNRFGDSINKIPRDQTAIIPPKAKLPVSPMKTFAGNELYHKNPMHAPTNELIKITSSEELGMYRIFK